MPRLSLCVLALAACERTPRLDPAPVVIPGAFPADRGPDSNTIILDAPRGLIVIDTGRHVEHQAKILAHAAHAQKPIAAIVNTHWHLDHSGGNAELRWVYPLAEIVATTAIDGAFVGFFPQSQASIDALVASGKATPEQLADIKLGRAALADRGNLRPTRAITATGTIDIAGRTLDVHVASFAATEADLWIHDTATHTVIAGDLVVAPVPFFDTGCPDGWRKALAEIDAVPFERLVPGHGDTMSHATFASWRKAFDALLDCAGSTKETKVCVAGWRRDAASFIPAGDEARIDEYTDYYITSILRSPDARARFCKPLAASAL